MDARKRTIIDWTLKNKKKLDLTVKQFTWTQKWLPGYFDFFVSINFEGIVYTGRGTDRDDEIAFLKAVVEAIERTLILYNGLQNSNGIALHTDPVLAKINSRNEYVERDIFLSHYLTKMPFYKIKNMNYFEPIRSMLFSESNIDKTLLECLEKIQRSGVKITFAEMQRIGDLYSVICIADGEFYKFPFGICIGMGCEKNLEDAIQKSMIECVRHIVSILETNEINLEKLSISEFSNIENHSVEDHIKLTNHPEYKKHIWSIFNLKDSHNISEYSELLSTIKTTPLNIPLLFSELPIYGYHSRSDFMQNLFFGFVTNNKLNLKRLSQFSKKNLNFEDIFSVPHPIG